MNSKLKIMMRLSTKDQEDGHSLDAQLIRLRDYCKNKSLDIIKEFTIIESSTRGGRPEFYKMIDYIKSQKDTVALVCDKVDRLQRGFTELPILDKLRNQGKLVLHFYSENQVLDENANSSQIFSYQIGIVVANNFTNCISDNVKRSYEKKLKEGTICRDSPIGYLNNTDDNGNKTVTLDPDRAFLIKKAFQDYATGLYSLKEIKDRATTNGLRSKRGLILTADTIDRILKNPFYSGEMLVKGKLYPHIYEKLIDDHLFMKCDKVRKERGKCYSKGTKTEFIFKGFVRCKKCDGLFSPEIKREKYIYLRPNSRNSCKYCKHTNEKVVLEAVTKALDSISIPDNAIESVKETIQASLEANVEYSKASIDALRKRHANLVIKQDKLLDMRIDDSITQDVYDKKSKQLSTEMHNIEVNLNKYTEANEEFAITLEYLIQLASKAKDIFKSSGIEQKRKILKLVFPNLYLEGKTVTFSMNKPFDSMVKSAELRKWQG